MGQTWAPKAACRPPSGLCILAGQPTARSSVNVFPQPVDVHRYRSCTAAETAVIARAVRSRLRDPNCAAPCCYRRARITQKLPALCIITVSVSKVESILYWFILHSFRFAKVWLPRAKTGETCTPTPAFSKWGAKGRGGRASVPAAGSGENQEW